VKEEREEEDGKSFVGMTNGIWDLELGPRIDELGRESLLITSNEKGTFVSVFLFSTQFNFLLEERN